MKIFFHALFVIEICDNNQIVQLSTFDYKIIELCLIVNFLKSNYNKICMTPLKITDYYMK